MYTFSPRTKIESAKVNANFLGLADGSLDDIENSLATFRGEVFYDFVLNGCLWSGDSYGSTRVASMTAGVVYINGLRVVVSAVASRTFTASKDTYIYVDQDGTLTYSEVSNNAASPSLPANSLLLCIIITGASTIANVGSINQGDPLISLPVVSSQYLRGADTNGVPIHNLNPVELSWARYGVASPAPSSEADVAGCTTTFTLAQMSDVRIDLQAHYQLNSGATRTAYWKLYIDGVATDQTWCQDNPGAPETHIDQQKFINRQLAAGAHTIKVRSVASSAGVVAMDGGFQLRIRGV